MPWSSCRSSCHQGTEKRIDELASYLGFIVGGASELRPTTIKAIEETEDGIRGDHEHSFIF
jgi:hypothetical protein